MTSYFLQPIGDMKDVLTRLDSEHERIHIEIYKHPRFKYWFHLYIDEVVTAPIQRLFLSCHFPFAEFFSIVFSSYSKSTLSIF